MMYCIINGCKNNQENDANRNILFHAFPLNPVLKARWLKAIGRSIWEPPDNARICNDHFIAFQVSLKTTLCQNYYYCQNINMKIMYCKRYRCDYPVNTSFDVTVTTESSLHLTENLAASEEVSSEPKVHFNLDSSFLLNSKFKSSQVEVCRICLAADDDVTLYSIQDGQQGKLKQYMVTISPINNDPSLPQFVCFECAAHLRKSYNMIKKSETSQEILRKIFEQNGEITKSLIKNLNRENLELKSPLEPHRVTPTYLLDYKFNHEKNVSFLTHNNYVYDLNEVKIEFNSKSESDSGHTNHDDGNDVTENLEQDSNGVEKSTSDHMACDDIETSVENDQELIIYLCDDFDNSALLSEESTGVMLIGANENNKNEENDANRVIKSVSDHVQSDDDETDVENVKDNSAVYIDLISEESTDGIPTSDDENIKNALRNVEKRKKSKVKSKIATTKSRKQSAENEDKVDDAAKHFNIVDLITIRERKEAWLKSIENPNWIRNEEHMKSVYKCEVCSKLFAIVKTYEQHRAYHDPSNGSVECPVCKRRHKTEKLVTQHMVKYHSKKFECKLCFKTYLNRVAAMKHYHVEHIRREYKCRRCSYSTRHMSMLSVHVQNAHPHAFACELCGRSCVTRAGLQRHYEIIHPGQQPVLEDGEVFSCDECKLKFISENALRVHLLTSAQHRDVSREIPELKNACKLCGALFQLHSELIEHKKADHIVYDITSTKPGGNKLPVKCDYCDKTLVSRRERYWHMRRDHPDQEYDRPVAAAICATCGRGFQSEAHLRHHELRHRPPRVPCDQCARMFYDKYALRQHHISFHSDERRYSCNMCDRSFKQKSNMARHMLIHTDVTPYECSLCGKQVKHKAGLKLHIRTVHDKILYPSVLNRKKRTRKRTNTKQPA